MKTGEMETFLEDYFASSGNTIIFRNDLKESLSDKQIDYFVGAGKLIRQGTQYDERRRERDTCYTLPYIAYMENAIAKKVVAHVNTPTKYPVLPANVIDKYIEEFEADAGWKLMEEQREAVHMAVNSQMCIITGGPGTGKTTVINAVRYVENHRAATEPFIRFTAPTGKAARRITESVGVPAMTIQMCIGANEYEDTPRFIEPDIMIVDEISMLDTITTYHLMHALSLRSKLILVGDVDQLPSVGYGSVLRDLIGSSVIPVTKLLQTMRQKGGTPLSDNIAKVRNGDAELSVGDDFIIINDTPEEQVVDEILKTMLAEYKEWGVENTILLTPFRRKGKTCANVMNELLQDKVNPDGKEINTTIVDIDEDGQEYDLHIRLRKGDPVMQLVNRKDCPIANGDVGMIVDIFNNGVFVDFGHYTKLYALEELNELNLAYAMSVHKSQGSEYKCVVTCALPEHEQMLNRNLVYTAITRAKKKCILYADHAVLEKAFACESGWERFTFLNESIGYQQKFKQLFRKKAA